MFYGTGNETIKLGKHGKVDDMTMQENDERLERAEKEGREAGKNKECFENNPYGPQYDAWARGWKNSESET